ncbi:hypothetical protein N0V93_005208 [Gnomoniopsis smithogilvyi]|uniref:Uncharacterized protein n=1 Tax=Gnomoniopsis smithogilvyi TaxID=1191159 RepID=A0A9W8YW87_9PEZI|nr:hypothetical protein N0V93_005208 [Gnomoniopsis smithogilvyi]
MKNETEARPFLEYSDDPAESGESGGIRQFSENSKNAIRNSRLARDLLVFLVASLLWLGAIFFLLPWPSSSGNWKPTNHAGSKSVQSGAGDYRLYNITSNAHFVTCGNSTAEAQRKGCRYDTLLNHWVPAACMDQEWIDEYEDDDSWTAFADVNLTQRLAPEDMGKREHYYTSIRDHVNHCAWLWRKQFWTLFENRKVFDGVIVNTYHTEHCAEFLSELMTMNRTQPTLVRVGFSGCWVKNEDEEL